MIESDRQFALRFAHVPTYGPDFLAASSNAEALTWLDRASDWPQHRLAVWGEPGCGKSHLLHLWSRRSGARVVSGPALEDVEPQAALAIDDADRSPGLALLHTLNAAAEAGLPVLIAGRLPPARWQASPADLASRLRAVIAVEIRAPEDSLLKALLARLLAERQLAIPETLQDWILLRLPRTPAAIRAAAEQIDRGGRPTRASARALVEEISATHAAAALRSGESSARDPDSASPVVASLL
jgi:chromosomal replication initiation ATPase DnaA